MDETQAGMFAADVLAVWWWFEDRGLVVVGQVVIMGAVYRSVGSTSQIEDFQRSLRVLICCVNFLRLWQRQVTVG